LNRTNLNQVAISERLLRDVFSISPSPKHAKGLHHLLSRKRAALRKKVKWSFQIPDVSRCEDWQTAERPTLKGKWRATTTVPPFA